MTQIEKALEELLTPHGYKITHRSEHYCYYYHRNDDKIIRLTGTRATLTQWNETQNPITIDLNHPNSLQIIENWAKTP